MILALMMLAQVDFDNIQMVLIWVVRMMLLEWATNAALLDLDTKTTRSFSLKGSTLRCVSCKDLEWILALLALVTSTFFGLRIFFRQNTTQQKSQSLCLPSNHIRSKSAKPTRTEDKAVFAACMNSVPPYVHFCNSMDNAPPYVYYCGTRTTGSFSLTGLTLRYVSCKDPEWILALLALVTSTFFGHRIFFRPEYDSTEISVSLPPMESYSFKVCKANTHRKQGCIRCMHGQRATARLLPHFYRSKDDKDCLV